MEKSIHSNQRNFAVSLIERHGIMRMSELKDFGVNPATLARLVHQGVLYRPTRGLYEISDADVEISHTLAQVAVRVPKAVICLISALQYHEITLQLPRRVWIAIGNSDRNPALESPRINVVHFGATALTMGVEIYKIDKVPVRIFDPAKSIVDCFRFRSNVGLDVALEALRLGWDSGKVNPHSVAQYAQNLRIWSVVRPYLESVVANERQTR